MKYHTWTIGCQMNTADTQRLAAELEKLGYVWSDVAEDADVIVLNTCVVRQQAEDKVVGRLTSLAPVKKERPGTVIALMGCLVGAKPARALAKQFPQVDVFLPPSETSPLVDALRGRLLGQVAQEHEAAALAARWAAQDEEAGWDIPERERARAVSAHVPVVYGCNWVCTFCIIPSRRGPERSRPEDDIVGEVRRLTEQGIREVMLLGQIVDRYGYDRGESDAFARLLERLNDLPGLARIRFLTSHPKFMTDSILDAVAGLPKVMEHIEVPVQAGSDRTLERMKRGYTVADYRRLVDRIRARVPNVAIHTDIIVGFSGETIEEFEGTAQLLEELQLDKAHLAKFSMRPGTVAAKLFADDVPAEEKERRRIALDAIQEKSCAAINARQLGETVEVLAESRVGARWRGRTRTSKIVFFDTPADVHGRLVDVRITWTGPWSMVGTVETPGLSTARNGGMHIGEIIPLSPALTR